MRIGGRKPSFNKSFKARTTGRMTRAGKRMVNPAYGRKGMGWVNNPKQAAYNKAYHKTTVGLSDLTRGSSGTKRTAAQVNTVSDSDNIQAEMSAYENELWMILIQLVGITILPMIVTFLIGGLLIESTGFIWVVGLLLLLFGGLMALTAFTCLLRMFTLKPVLSIITLIVVNTLYILVVEMRGITLIDYWPVLIYLIIGSIAAAINK